MSSGVTRCTHRLHAHVIDRDATLGQQFFHIPVGEPVAQVSANREHDHLRWEAEPHELDLNVDLRRERRRIGQVCLVLPPTDATAPHRGC